jgi:deoxyadenosine/deoxycytidine kinase
MFEEMIEIKDSIHALASHLKCSQAGKQFLLFQSTHLSLVFQSIFLSIYIDNKFPTFLFRTDRRCRRMQQKLSEKLQTGLRIRYKDLSGKGQ